MFIRLADHFTQWATGHTLPSWINYRRGYLEYEYDVLVRNIENALQGRDMNAADAELREIFKGFLDNSGLRLSSKNFEKLLEEKSGEKLRRSDGTISWHHELIISMSVLALARVGKMNGGFDLRDLEPYGGLDVLIPTALRHDSVEDGTSMEEFKSQLAGMCSQIKKEDPSCDLAEKIGQTEKIVVNVDLLTQKKFLDANGDLQKQDVREYMAAMINSNEASPIVFLLKQADTCHNFATMLGAGKFSAERRAQRLNERDRIYGGTYTMRKKATKKWPRFESSIHTLDANFREIIFKNFRYLESVDCFYDDAPPAFKRTGSLLDMEGEYLDQALVLDLPKPLHVLHIYLDRMTHSVNPTEDAAFKRLQDHIHYTIKPSLAHRSECFPSLFPPKPPPEIIPWPIAF